MTSPEYKLHIQLVAQVQEAEKAEVAKNETQNATADEQPQTVPEEDEEVAKAEELHREKQQKVEKEYA